MQGSTILLVDDDRETRWALATVLRREGAKVSEAAGGDEGLLFLRRNPYDLVVTDVCMPGLGGFGLFAALRFPEGEPLVAAPDTPVMLISGRAPTRDLAHALDAGVDEFMEKPIDPEEFKARVRAILRRARARAVPTARTRGDLRDFGMAALAQALHLAGRSGRLRVQSGNVGAVLDFQRGVISHAIYEGLGVNLRGDPAAIHALGLEKGTFEILPVPETAPRTVFADTDSLVLQAATHADETACFADAMRAAFQSASAPEPDYAPAFDGWDSDTVPGPSAPEPPAEAPESAVAPTTDPVPPPAF